MKRRTLLSTTALLPVSTLLACTMPATTSSQLATDANLIATGLASVITSLQQTPGAPAATLAQLSGYLATLQTDAALLSTATVQTSATQPAGTVQEISQLVSAVASIVLPLVPGGSVMEIMVQAATSLLPSLLTAAGLDGSRPSAPTRFTPMQARLILAAHAPAVAADVSGVGGR